METTTDKTRHGMPPGEASEMSAASKAPLDPKSKPLVTPESGAGYRGPTAGGLIGPDG
jgi:hypothetical protein